MEYNTMISMFLRVFCLILLIRRPIAQYSVGSPLYNQQIKQQLADLLYTVQSNPDVRSYFDASSGAIDTFTYVDGLPNPQDYIIRILMDPCRYNAYNCCIGLFGSAEYPALLSPNLENERIFKPYIIASDTEVMKNYQLVTEDSIVIETSAIRSVDDYSVYDERCTALNTPFTNCSGLNWAQTRASERPPCSDNNYSLNALSDCFDIYGNRSSKCVQVGYSQNAFIPQCIDNTDPHCGSFLEIHMPRGSPYYSENTIISEVRLTLQNITGTHTTTIPLTFMNNESRSLCSYTESFLRIGTPVYINPTAPSCCCPATYSSATRLGSLQCPKGPAGDGAFAYFPKSVTDYITLDSLNLNYPFCPTNLAGNDSFLCSVFDSVNSRYFVSNCSKVSRRYQYDPYSYTSSGLAGITYGGVCPYFDSCALVREDGGCHVLDSSFTFRGQVGIITKLETIGSTEMAWVSFNDGRTSYLFDTADIKINTISRSMYEIWFVVRTPSNFVLRKRKGFNVTSPACTYDATNSRYLPYAELSAGTPVATIVYV